MRRTSSSRFWVLLSVLTFAGYPASYALSRASHLLVHESFWTSAEGLDGHHVHSVVGQPVLATLFAPLIEVELALQRLRQP